MVHSLLKGGAVYCNADRTPRAIGVQSACLLRLERLPDAKDVELASQRLDVDVRGKDVIAIHVEHVVRPQVVEGLGAHTASTQGFVLLRQSPVDSGDQCSFAYGIGLVHVRRLVVAGARLLCHCVVLSFSLDIGRAPRAIGIFGLVEADQIGQSPVIAHSR